MRVRVFSLFVALLVLSVAVAAAGPWTPSKMTISAQPSIQYAFNGSNVPINFTLGGAPMVGVFFVYTKDKAATVGKVKNGYLGWHYVNNIDTCVYMSAPVEYAIGNNTFTWNGRNKVGGIVAPDTYKYYFWGFDGMNAKALVSNSVTIPQSVNGTWNLYDEKDVALAAPEFYTQPGMVSYMGTARAAGFSYRGKWTVGKDALDSSLVEICRVPIATGASGMSAKIALLPGDHTQFIDTTLYPNAPYHHYQKFTWVSGGDAILDTKWGDSGEKVYTSTQWQNSGPVCDNISLLMLPEIQARGPRETPLLAHYVDIADGSEYRTYDWQPDFQASDEEYQKALTLSYTVSQGPRYVNFTKLRGFPFAGGFVEAGNQHCKRILQNPYTDVDADVTVWVNGNGDWVGDRHFQTDAGDAAWMCNSLDGAGWVYDIFSSEEGFVYTDQFDLGNVSFCSFGPDGTGIGYFSFAGETALTKFGQMPCDTGTAYDGLYMDPAARGQGLWYIAAANFKGVISSKVGVAESQPSAFSVAQNSPNPFNPTTAISFTLVKPGNVTVDIFNSAGQKVDTIVNTTMTAGSHSVTWNASKFSAGVYFYTVKSGEFSKTMKMTLLK